MKPACKLSGTDGNVFVIISNVCRAVKEDDQKDKANEFRDKAFQCADYDAVIQLAMDYVEVE